MQRLTTQGWLATGLAAVGAIAFVLVLCEEVFPDLVVGALMKALEWPFILVATLILPTVYRLSH